MVLNGLNGPKWSFEALQNACIKTVIIIIIIIIISFHRFNIYNKFPLQKPLQRKCK